MSVAGADSGDRGWRWGSDNNIDTANPSSTSSVVNSWSEKDGVEIPATSNGMLFHPTQGRLNVGLLIMQLHIKTNDLVVNTQYTIINSHSLKIANVNAEVLRQMEEQANNVAKAEKGGLVGEIFGYVATAITVVAAIVTLNPVLLVSAAFSIAMIILTETGALEKIVDKMGMEMFIVIIVVLSLATMFAAGAAGSATQAAKTTQQVIAGSELASSAAEIGSGVSKTVSSKFVYDAAMINGKITRILAEADVFKGELDDLLEMFQFSMERYYLILKQGREMLETSARTERHIASV